MLLFILTEVFVPFFENFGSARVCTEESIEVDLFCFNGGIYGLLINHQ